MAAEKKDNCYLNQNYLFIAAIITNNFCYFNTNFMMLNLQKFIYYINKEIVGIIKN